MATVAKRAKRQALKEHLKSGAFLKHAGEEHDSDKAQYHYERGKNSLSACGHARPEQAQKLEEPGHNVTKCALNARTSSC
ncbi:hypothetical protein GN956_G4320 [Arapaima gigas]